MNYKHYTQKKEGFEYYKRKVENLEKEVYSLKKREKKRKRKQQIGQVSGIAGAAGAAVVTKLALEDILKGFGESVGGLVDAVKTADAIMNVGVQKDKTLMNSYLSKISPDVRKAYENANSQNYFKRVTEAGRTALETMSRGFENFPGNQSKPIKGLKKVRKWIIEKTRAPFESKNHKGETKIRGTEHYDRNYNQLAELKADAYRKRRDIQNEMIRVARTAEINKQKGNLKAAEKGVKEFENLAKTYAYISEKFIDEINSLGVREINNDAIVEQRMREAEKYGIERDNFDGYADGVFLAGLVAASALGYYAGRKLGRSAYTIARPIAYTAKALYQGSKKLSKRAVKTAKLLKNKAVNKFKKKNK